MLRNRSPSKRGQRRRPTPHQAAGGADEVDPGGVGGALLVAGGAGGAVDVLQEQAAAVLHHGARLRHPQVADGDGLRVRALRTCVAVSFPFGERTTASFVTDTVGVSLRMAGESYRLATDAG